MGNNQITLKNTILFLGCIDMYHGLANDRCNNGSVLMASI